jgi:hypothetical protein
LQANDVLPQFIEIEVENDDQFLILRESLTRIGVANKATKTLYQSCHVLHKRGRYYLVHFKQIFLLDGKPASLSVEDYGRLKKISEMVTQWGLTKTLYVPEFMKSIEPVGCFVLTSQQKREWELVQKYKLGNKP